MEQSALARDRSKRLKPQPIRVNTTLYDLVEAVAEELGPGEDRVVTRVVVRLLGKGRVRVPLH